MTERNKEERKIERQKNPKTNKERKTDINKERI